MKLTLIGEINDQTFAVNPRGEFFVREKNGWQFTDEVPLEIVRASVSRHPRARWTRESIIAAIQEFHRRYGRPPVATDWNVALAKVLGHSEKVERFYRDRCWPHSNTVYGGKYGAFESWGDAIVAAGFPRPLPGRYVTETRGYYAKVRPKRKCVDCGAETTGTRCRPCHLRLARHSRWGKVKT